MRRSNKVIVKVASIALIGILGITIIKPSFAQEIVDKIADFISIGHVTVVESQGSENELIEIPEIFKGKIFDKNGNAIETIPADEHEKIYTADGEEIADLYLDTGTITTVSEMEKELEEGRLVVKDVNKLNDYTCFEVILPKYLPEGYKFDKAEFYKDENGLVENSKYISLYFNNDETGEFIFMQQRFADEETAYVTGGQKVEKLKINGADAILYDDNLDWEDNGVIYMLGGRGIPKDELIKIAESFK